ncbi:MAG: FAD-dependent oxidoreductase [bacterium]|nr:FAD-dependent oxidoreductase [bacterium]
MAAKRHVIVGGGTAGWNAITTIREIDGGASEIVLVSRETPYARMVLPYYLAGEIGESQVYTATAARLAELKVEARIGKSAARLDTGAKKLHLDDGEELDYDTLLIATGSSPVRAPIPGADGDRVHSFWTLDQAKAVVAGLAPRARVTMVGAGFISFTILNALVRQGVQLTILEIAPRILPRMVDAQGAALVEKWLTDEGVAVHAGAEVTAIEDAGGAKVVKMKGQSGIPADLVIMATGIRPNLEWLEGSGVEVQDGVVVDDHLRASAPDVYAAGDIAEGKDLVTGGAAVHAIEPTAMQHGRVAGANMAGQDAAYGGSLLMNIVDVLDLEIASFGSWEDSGAEVIEGVQADRPAYRKLLFRGGRLTGAIILGKSGDIWTTNDVGMLKGLVQTGRDISEWKDHLRENPFHVKSAFVASGTVGDLLPRTLLGRPSMPEREINVS